MENPDQVLSPEQILSRLWDCSESYIDNHSLISFITVLNIMNSVSMGVSARIRQYGVMRAVGMESGQVTKMIIGEAVVYAFCGTIIISIMGGFL